MVNPLNQNPLGRTGLNVAALSLGTVKLGRSAGVKYPDPVVIPDDDEARILLARARDLGINLLDTAPAYGNSETRLGELLGPDRRNWLICTKVGEEFDGQTSTYDFTPEHVGQSVERSMGRLNTDYLDIVLIHSNGEDEEILKSYGTLEALQALKKKGYLRAVGISHKSAHGADLAVAAGADVIMATLNRSDTSEADAIEKAAQAGCGVLIKKALGSGYGTPADLPWVLGHPGVHSIVVGTTNVNHLEENVSSINRG